MRSSTSLSPQRRQQEAALFLRPSSTVSSEPEPEPFHIVHVQVIDPIVTDYLCIRFLAELVFSIGIRMWAVSSGDWTDL